MEVQAEGVIEVRHEVDGHPPDDRAEALDGHEPDLFGLSLGLDPQTGLVGR